MKEIKTFEAFAGYGSQLIAMRRLEKQFPDKIKVTPIGFSEIEPAAIKAYIALHGNVKNYGDITKIDWNEVPDFDLFTYSFPCTDISAAGHQKGLERGSGTRSSLLWECERAITIKRPKYLLMENVKALVQSKFIRTFNEWQTLLERLGYVNFAKVLNSKDFGIPQNRERIFLVSIRADGLDALDGKVQYHFPKPFPLEKRLKDVLEEKVDERYYLSDKMLEYFNRVNGDDTHGHKFKPTDGGGTATVVKANPATNADDNFIFSDE